LEGEPMTDEIARQALETINRLMRDKDPAVADLFVPDALLVGSEVGEIARGREAIAALFAGIHAHDYAVWWDFPLLDSGGDTQRVWLFAEGHVVLERVSGSDRLPYRLSAALVAEGDDWRWELFHGSEPRG
jgi:ketosteroid isomerase-like protein